MAGDWIKFEVATSDKTEKLMTNTTKSKLLELADRVEAGNATNGDVWKALNEHRMSAGGKHYQVPMRFEVLGVPKVDWVNAYWVALLEDDCPEYLTSLDAAQSLHDAVLPGWCVENICDQMAAWQVELNKTGTNIMVTAEATKPSAAWVAAILRAKAGID